MRLGQGRENAKQFIRENPDLFEEIRQGVLVKRGIVQAAGGAPEAKEADAEPAKQKA
ncbi:MAG: hypothetical protein ACYTJ0_17095 [Planctomycetota bacterium]